MYKSIKRRKFKKICYRYFKRCPFCGYSGIGWGDSGECPCCGETS